MTEILNKGGMMKSFYINHLSGLKENMLITTSDKLTSVEFSFAHVYSDGTMKVHLKVS